jgi:ABC-2 type transport system permease protein
VVVRASRVVLRQARLEQHAFWRNPEAAFFTFALPIGLLLIFGATSGAEKIPGRPDLPGLTFFVPGILAFGIIVAAYGNLAATIAILRSDGVLKRLRATPLPPGAYLAGQLLSVLATSLLIAVTTIALGRIAFGVAPASAGDLVVLAATLGLGITCFAALGLAISAFIPDGTAAAAITNGTYIPLALVSGTFNTKLHLPAWLDTTVAALPIRALTDGLRAGYDPAAHGWPVANLAVLAVWILAGIALAVRYYRWEAR